MQHKWITPLSFKCIDNLCVSFRAERTSNDCLGLTAGKERGSVGPREHAGFDTDRSDGLYVPAVNSRLI